MSKLVNLSVLLSCAMSAQSFAQEITLFKGVNVFTGHSPELLLDHDVLVKSNKIVRVAQNIESKEGINVIHGKGKTLMPGMIDAHTHTMFQGTMPDLMNKDLAYTALVAAKRAEETLNRGFTSVRDLAGNPFSLAKTIDDKLYVGPRIVASGAMISQTSGHSDTRSNVTFEDQYVQDVGHLTVADGVDEVLIAVRQNLMRGASFIKISAGGGVASSYDPLDVTQYTLPEMQAAVDAAADYGTYVSAHAYTDKAVQRAIKAGVKVIEHGQMIGEETAKMMAENDVWLNVQPFLPEYNPYPEKSFSHAKYKMLAARTDRAIKAAKEHGVKITWGTDVILAPEAAHLQSQFVADMANWFTPYEVLKMVTHDNGQLLAMSGLRSPYQDGKLGVIEEGAYADILLVNGNPLEDITLMAKPDSSLALIMKDGDIVKSSL